MPKYIDLTGQKFGQLSVIRLSDRKAEFKYWTCVCECGTQKDIRSDVLRKRNITSCGCQYLNFKIGDKINMLTVVERIGSKRKLVNKNQNVYWKCICECGKITEQTTTTLMYKIVQSCGCYTKKHGRLGLYSRVGDISPWLWGLIIRGAQNRNLEFTIDMEYAWDIFIQQKGKCALTGLNITFAETARQRKFATASLDRIDSSQGYIKGNVQWVHKDINIMKQDYSQQYFINMCKLVNNWSKC